MWIVLVSILCPSAIVLICIFVCAKCCQGYDPSIWNEPEDGKQDAQINLRDIWHSIYLSTDPSSPAIATGNFVQNEFDPQNLDEVTVDNNNTRPINIFTISANDLPPTYDEFVRSLSQPPAYNHSWLSLIKISYVINFLLFFFPLIVRRSYHQNFINVIDFKSGSTPVCVLKSN